MSEDVQCVFLDQATIDIGDIDWQHFESSLPGCRRYDQTGVGELMERVRGAEVIISNKVVIDDAVMAACPDLALIGVAATGVNNIDIPAAHKRGIRVCHVRDYATTSVVEHVFAMLLSLRRRICSSHASVRSGKWSGSDTFCLIESSVEDLAGCKFGIVGYGVLGKAVARMAACFGMDTLVAERKQAGEIRPGRLPFDEVLRQADIVSLHCPLSSETADLIGARELAMMKSSSILINTARGGIVDEQALLQALHSGEIAAAGLDVLLQEPPPADHPLLAADLPNLLLTPHVAWGSRQARQALLDQLADTLRLNLAGTDSQLVYPD